MIFAFGDCHLDAHRFELRRAGLRVDVQPKVLELLLYLVRARGRLVSKRELLESLWPDVVVGESSLTRLVSLARRSIGDRRGETPIIETVPGRGYRLVARVTEPGEERPPVRKLAAILSADVVDYSRLMAADEAATVQTLTRYRSEIEALVERHGGRVVDFRGDDLLAEFPSALYATGCAVEIQRSLAMHNTELPSARQMRFRIGLHLGDVRVEGEQLFGDGINIAARLETLSDPGGICISDGVYQQVQRALELTYVDLGEQRVKNIPDPVHAYRVEVEPVAAEPRNASETDAPHDRVVPGFSERSAIAVLPFDDMSPEGDQEYFADGLAEDLILRLSQFRWFPVVARNSSFAYKGRALDVKQIGRELGVRYVVQGSVRRSSDRVRIGSQLIDADRGHNVWGDRYDRQVRDVFAVQDEISDAIAAAIEPELWQSESELAVRRPPQNLGAWDCLHRGWWFLVRSAPAGGELHALCERALDLDPRLPRAFYALASSRKGAAVLHWTSTDPAAPRSALREAEGAAGADSRDPIARLELACAHALDGHYDRMRTALDAAVRLRPNQAMTHRWLGLLLAAIRRNELAVESEAGATRDDPLRRVFRQGIAVAEFAAGDYEAVLRTIHPHVDRPDVVLAYGLSAASLAQLGRTREARTLLEDAAGRLTEFSLEALDPILSGLDAEVRTRFEAGLSRTGWIETRGAVTSL